MLVILALLISQTYSTIIITSPINNPFQNSQINYSYANFGIVPYGKTMAFKIKPIQNFCTHNSSLHFQQPTYILIVKAEGCSYTQNALNAQQSGAKGIIFGSDIAQKHGQVVVVDDGNGRKVHITVLIINTNNLNTLLSLQNLMIKTSFIVPKTEVSKVFIFLSSMGRQSYVLLRDFLPYYELIGSYIQLKPIYYTIECTECSNDDCLFNNKYCALGIQQKDLGKGQLILKQSLRQYQIHNRQGTLLWLKYMDLFDKFCDYDWISSNNCSQQICSELNIKKGLLEDDLQQVMQNWRINQKKSGFVSYPQVSVNGIIFQGNFHAGLLFDMVCNSLKQPPQQCTTPTITQQQLQNHHQITLIVILILGSVLSIMLGLYCYCKFIRREITMDMSSKVNEIVARYATKVSEQKIRHKQRMMQQLSEQL